MEFILAYMFWPFVFQYYYQRTHSHKIARNLVALTDTCICVSAAFTHYYYQSIYGWYISLYFPLFYYLWDIQYIAIQAFQKDKLYIVHHCIALYVIFEILTESKSFQMMVYPMLIAAEASNVPLHITYHILKRYPQNKKLIFNVKLVQLMTFFMLRIVYYTSLIFTISHKIPFFFRLSLLSIYGMGLIWFTKQFSCFLSEAIKIYKN